MVVTLSIKTLLNKVLLISQIYAIFVLKSSRGTLSNIPMFWGYFEWHDMWPRSKWQETMNLCFYFIGRRIVWAVYRHDSNYVLTFWYSSISHCFFITSFGYLVDNSFTIVFPSDRMNSPFLLFWNKENPIEMLNTCFAIHCQWT